MRRLTGLGMKHMRNTVLLIGLATIASLAVVQVAAANQPILNAQLNCSGAVTWQLQGGPPGDDNPGSYAITDLSLGGATEASGPLMFSGAPGYVWSASGSYTIPTSATSDTVTANMTWNGGVNNINTISVLLTRPANCTPPPVACTYTKGFYRNHADVTATVIAGMGGTVTVGSSSLTDAQAQAILNATPGQPGSVTFTSNNLLNLVQQLITAELNAARGSAPVPTAAIAAANAAIGVSGNIALSSGLNNGQVGALITPLDSFNSSNDCG
jgi:hypothetical protein